MQNIKSEKKNTTFNWVNLLLLIWALQILNIDGAVKSKKKVKKQVGVELGQAQQSWS